MFVPSLTLFTLRVSILLPLHPPLSHRLSYMFLGGEMRDREHANIRLKGDEDVIRAQKALWK
jgi:hypothetical protein